MAGRAINFILDTIDKAMKKGYTRDEASEMVANHFPVQPMQAFSPEGQEFVDRVLMNTRRTPVPSRGQAQGYQSFLFEHTSPKRNMTSYDLDAPKIHAGMSPEGLYAATQPERTAKYVQMLKDAGENPETYRLVSRAEKIFVRGADKPNQAMIDAYEKMLKEQFGGDERYIAQKLDEFKMTGVPPTDMSRKARSDIYRAGGADALLDGQDIAFLRPEQTRRVDDAKFDWYKKEENNWLAGAAPVASGGILGALGYKAKPQKEEDDTANYILNQLTAPR